MNPGENLVGTNVSATQAIILSHGTKIYNEGFEAGERIAIEHTVKIIELLLQEFDDNPLRLKSDGSRGIYLGLKRSLEALIDSTLWKNRKNG
jgi:hypothetical protein